MGGGDAAADKALQLASFAKNVTILVREATMKAAAVIQGYVRRTKNISIKYNIDVQEVTGDGKKVTGVVIKDRNSGKTETVPVNGAYFALGFMPNTKLFADDLKFDRYGYIQTRGKTQATSIPGVFAAGTVEDAHYQKASVAAGNGVKAGLDAISFLQDHGITPISLQPWQSNYATISVTSKKVPLITTSSELQTIVATKERVLLDCYVPHCPLCAMLSSVMEQVAAQVGTEVFVIKVNVDKVPDIKQQFQVDHVPTVLLLHKGKEIARTTEVYTVKDVMNFIQSHTNKNIAD